MGPDPRCSTADVGQQPEVFAELQGKALRGGVVPASAECDPEVFDAVEVVTDQFVEAVALPLVIVAVTGTCPPSR
jgi:hypothetical protein